MLKISQYFTSAILFIWILNYLCKILQLVKLLSHLSSLLLKFALAEYFGTVCCVSLTKHLLADPSPHPPILLYPPPPQLKRKSFTQEGGGFVFCVLSQCWCHFLKSSWYLHFFSSFDMVHFGHANALRQVSCSGGFIYLVIFVSVVGKTKVLISIACALWTEVIFITSMLQTMMIFRPQQIWDYFPLIILLLRCISLNFFLCVNVFEGWKIV